MNRPIGIAAALLVIAVVGVVAPLARRGDAQTSPPFGFGDPRRPITKVPVTIAAPGSYYFVHDLDDLAGTGGITVKADCVTIDLNGFCLHGGGGTFDGIVAPNPVHGLEVKDGTIAGWGGSGVEASTSEAVHLENVDLRGNGRWGVKAAVAARFERCGAFENGTAGTGGGLHAANSSMIVDCTARQNDGIGILVGDCAAVRGCIAQENASQGVLIGRGSMALDTVARGNGGIGIQTNGSTATFSRCNATDNGSHGFDVGDTATVSDCLASENDGHGFLLNDRVLITRCVSGSHPNGAGIRSQHNCLVRENLVTDNLYGIHLYGSRTRAEANHSTQNTGEGITTLNNGASDCTVIGNTSARNAGPDYNINSSCSFGTLISSPPNPFSTDQPFTNFGY